jgi:hypothetical protein
MGKSGSGGGGRPAPAPTSRPTPAASAEGGVKSAAAREGKAREEGEARDVRIGGDVESKEWRAHAQRNAMRTRYYV